MTPNKAPFREWERNMPVTRTPYWVRRVFGHKCPYCRARMKILCLNEKDGREVWGCETCNARKTQSVDLIFTKPPTVIK